MKVPPLFDFYHSRELTVKTSTTQSFRPHPTAARRPPQVHILHGRGHEVPPSSRRASEEQAASCKTSALCLIPSRKHGQSLFFSPLNPISPARCKEARSFFFPSYFLHRVVQQHVSFSTSLHAKHRNYHAKNLCSSRPCLLLSRRQALLACCLPYHKQLEVRDDKWGPVS